MGYADRVIESPYAWLLIVAIALGIALRNLVLLLADRRAPTRMRDRRLTLLFVATALVVALATATLVIYGPGPLVAAEALLFLGIVAGLLTLAFVFLRLVGIPLLFLLSAFGVLGIYLAQPWQPVADRLELAELTVLSADDEQMRLELRPYPGEPTGENLVRLPGRRLGVTVELVRYHPYWFVLGRELGARLVSVESYDAVGEGELEDLALPQLCSDPVCRFVNARMSAVPGITVETVRTSSVPTAPLLRYRVVVEPPARIRLAVD
jgi:hypothetical protein